ncbi:MAG: hypothetical protein JWR19_565 [Pedosphaera sp.]|nr:hypothetical protein [Pedosphaera sp.]
MARKLRVQYPGTVYHVLDRGDRRESSFKADDDLAMARGTTGDGQWDQYGQPAGRLPPRKTMKSPGKLSIVWTHL